MQIRLEDHSAEVYKELESACQRALEKCGLVAEGHAKKMCPVDTGNLRNSITHTVADSEKAAYVGSPVSYATYVECGTGKYYLGGRPTPWVYQDSEGNWHRTSGQPARPFIKPAVANHLEQYQKIIKKELKNE